ncbi:alpha/beta hydrolase [Nonomuraea angiospora]|uniref:alpha/beta hydrolase n=1 Tax=Nonomuraea angiospora TaxID=46172 RepID=UPI00343983F2
MPGDPATVYPWALSTTRQLGRSGRLLTYEGWGHIVYGRGACATGAADAYLISQPLPAPGTRCPAVPPLRSGRSGSPSPLCPERLAGCLPVSSDELWVISR